MAATPKPMRKKTKELELKKHAKKMPVKHSKEEMHEAAKHMKMHGG